MCEAGLQNCLFCRGNTKGRPMKLSQCSAFVAIADSGTFTKAAASLGISQSAVSHAIAGLEAELGVALMKRDRSGVEITEIGQRVLAHARSLLLHSEQMRQEAAADRDDLGGRIRIGTSQSFACRLLPALMTHFRGKFPGLEIQLRDGYDGQIADYLHKSAVDVGIVTLPKPGIKTFPLLEDQLYALLPERHRLASAPEVHIRQLADEPLMLPAGTTERTVRSLFRASGLEPRIAHCVHDLNTVLAMVSEGHGVSALPSLAMPSVSEGVVAVPLSPQVRRRLGIGVSARAKNLSAVAAFIAAAQAMAASRDWLLPPGVIGAPGVGTGA